MSASFKSMVSWRAVLTRELEEEQLREKEYLYQQVEFNDSGSPLSEETYFADGLLEHKYSYQYDDKNRLIEEMLIEEDEFISEHRTMDYNEGGLLKHEYRHYQDETCDTTEFIYDDEGRLLSKRTVDSDGEEESRTEYSYHKGLLILEKTDDSENDARSEKRFSYDDSGRLLEESVNSREENYRHLNEYDEKGRRLISRRYNGDGHLVERVTFTYDDADNAVSYKEETTAGISFTALEYDAGGRIIMQEETSESGALISRISRRYDENGLLLENSVFVEGSSRRAPQDYRIRYEYK